MADEIWQELACAEAVGEDHHQEQAWAKQTEAKAEEMAMRQLRAMAEAKRLRRRVAEAAAEAARHRIAKQKV